MKSLALLTALTVLAALTMMPANAVGNQAPAGDTPLDAEQLPVSLRIKRKLDRVPVAADERKLLFDGFDVHNGPVPYGAPTHATMRDVTTPIEFRSPTANIGNVLGWAWKHRQSKKVREPGLR